LSEEDSQQKFSLSKNFKASSSGISIDSETEDTSPSFTKYFDLFSEFSSLIDFEPE